MPYRVIWVAAVFIGCVSKIELVWIFCRLRQRTDVPAQPHFPAGTFRRACPANAVLPLAAQAGRLRRIPHTGRKITIFLTRIQIILAFRLPVVFTSPRSPCKPKSRVRLAVQDSRLSRGQHGFESRTRCQLYRRGSYDNSAFPLFREAYWKNVMAAVFFLARFSGFRKARQRRRKRNPPLLLNAGTCLTSPDLAFRKPRHLLKSFTRKRHGLHTSH